MFKKTVDSVLSTFTKAIADLDNITQTKIAEAGDLTKVALQAEYDATTARDEANRAAAISVKISELVS